jgi:hypothetical protein
VELVEEATSAPWLNPQSTLSPVVEEVVELQLEDPALLLSEMPVLPQSELEKQMEAASMLSDMMDWAELPELGVPNWLPEAMDLPESVEEEVAVAVPMGFLSLSEPQTSLSLWTVMFEPVWRRSTLRMWQDLNEQGRMWLPAPSMQLRMFPLLMEYLGAKGQICSMLQARLAWRLSCLPQAMAPLPELSQEPAVVMAVLIAISTGAPMQPVDIWCEATPWRLWVPMQPALLDLPR